MSLFNPRSIAKKIVSKFGEMYLRSYSGLEEVFYRRNHVIAFDIDRVLINIRDPWVPSVETREHIAMGLQLKPLMYDGLSLKLWSFAFDRSQSVLTFDVSYGRYSQYFFTNLDEEFRKKFPSPKSWFNPLNIGALVMTGDNMLWFHRRPAFSRQSPGKIDTPCGHPTGMSEQTEPEDLVSQALRTIISKEMGYIPTILELKPLVAFWAHPDYDFNLMYLVKIRETSNELYNKALSAKQNTEDFIFVSSETDSLTTFLRSHKKLSRSAPEAILHLIRLQRLEKRFSNKS
jgi:hypothetical protein